MSRKFIQNQKIVKYCKIFQNIVKYCVKNLKFSKKIRNYERNSQWNFQEFLMKFHWVLGLKRIKILKKEIRMEIAMKFPWNFRRIRDQERRQNILHSTSLSFRRFFQLENNPFNLNFNSIFSTWNRFSTWNSSWRTCRMVLHVEFRIHFPFKEEIFSFQFFQRLQWTQCNYFSIHRRDLSLSSSHGFNLKRFFNLNFFYFSIFFLIFFLIF